MINVEMHVLELQWSTTLITLSRYEMYLRWYESTISQKQDYFDQFMHHQQNFAICMQQNLIDYSLGCDMFTLQILEHCKFREETT